MDATKNLLTHVARCSRRRLLHWAASTLAWTGAAMLGACQQKVVEVQRIVEVEKEVTKEITKEIIRVVPMVVRETVIVQTTPQIIEKVITAQPTAKPRSIIVAHATAYGWTRFAQQTAPAFEELFPQIAIEWRSVSDWNAYPRQIAALHAADQLGDLVEGPFGSLLALWAQAGLIRPLDEVMAADGFDASGLFQATLQACRYEGQQIGLPFVGHAGDNLLLYNRELFDQAKINPPAADWTLEDLSQAASRLRRDGGAQGEVFAMGLDGDLPSAYALVHLFGAQFISTNGQSVVVDGAANLAFLRWAYDWWRQRGGAPTPSQVAPGLETMFRAGRLAMWRGSLRTLLELQRAASQPETIGAVLFPTRPETKRVGAVATGMAFCLTRRSQLLLDTFQWIKFISSQGLGVRMFLEGYAEPGCRVAAWQDPRVVERSPICAALAQAANTAEIAHLPWNLRHADCLDAWNRGIRLLWANEITPQACAARIARDVQAILAQPLRPSELTSFPATDPTP